MRAWSISIQNGEYSIHLYEATGWRAWAVLVEHLPCIGCRQLRPRLLEWIAWHLAGRWHHKLIEWVDGLWTEVARIPVTVEQARGIRPEFVSAFERERVGP